MTDIYVQPEFDLGKCHNCPRALHLLAELEAAEELAHGMADTMLEIPFDEISNSLHEAMQPYIEQGMVIDTTGRSIESLDDVTTTIREGLLTHVETQDQQADQIRTQLRQLLDTCPDGTLKMRAARNGRQVIVTMRMSGSIPDGEHCEDTHTTRSTQ